MKRIFLISILIFSLILRPNLIAGGFVLASTQQEIDALNKQISEHKEKIKQLQDSIDGYKKNIEQKKLEAVSLSNQLSILNNHLSRLQADISLTDEKIKTTQLEIDSLDFSIEQKEKIVSRQRQLIAKMLRDIDKEQNKNYLEVLLTNKSLSEFYNQIQYKQTIYQDLGQTTKGLRLAKEDLQAKKIQNEKYKKEQEDLKIKLLAQRRDFHGQTEYKTGLLVQTKSSEYTYQTILANLKQQYQQTDNEIRSYEQAVQKKLADQNKIPKTSDVSTNFIWPTNRRYIPSYFHDPEYPYRHVFEHSAIDIGIGQRTPLYAAASGYVAVARACYSSSCYAYTLIVHTSNLSTLYGHMSDIVVSVDQFVNQGDLIGYSGGTPGTIGAGPFVTGPHLHFEIRASGIPVNPLNYLP